MASDVTPRGDLSFDFDALAKWLRALPIVLNYLPMLQQMWAEIQEALKQNDSDEVQVQFQQLMSERAGDRKMDLVTILAIWELIKKFRELLKK